MVTQVSRHDTVVSMSLKTDKEDFSVLKRQQSWNNTEGSSSPGVSREGMHGL